MKFKAVTIIGILLMSTVALATPPFVNGQVVIEGSPMTIPSGYQVVKYLPNANLTVVAVSHGSEWGHVQQLIQHGRRAGLNYLAKKNATVDDPFFSYQWHFTNIQANQAWDVSTGVGATVAVLDTGLRAGGEDGIGCLVAGIDIVYGNPDPHDGDGHGTHVSGTIAQATNNATGVAGLAHGACVMPVKVLDDSGSGSFADIADGIIWAVDHGADVINMSLGTDARHKLRNDPIVDPALDYAYLNNVTVVCAAGNDGWRRNVGYPAIYHTTIAVGATDYNNKVVRYSNKGDGLDLVAPGGDTSKDLNGDGYVDGVLQETYVDGGWGYYFYQGTSMATPHVAALAAMLIANGTANSPGQVLDVLAATALDLNDAGYDSTSGHGLIQAYDALLNQPCVDGDGDGYTDASCGGNDCNDANAAVNPAADEICDDTIDNDCDGDTDDLDTDCGTCLPRGDPCTSDTQCCSGKCHPRRRTCN
jgi:serine protease